MNVSVVLFTSDLRLHDHPPLRAAGDGGRQVVPLFVLSLIHIETDAGLRERGGRLVMRSGDVVDQVCRV
ncbi:deoxyribodipyrimidine photo-lyase, partial [Streptomyces resistomycificus]|uniref:deoxyribodipyrimidine photo-lyase n=1 Tax=Streptomyces resistomycificus TaxID=67356 RepID=UPI000565B286